MPTLAEIDAEIARRQQASALPSIDDIDAEIAKRQQAQSNPQPTEPMSKLDAIKQGFGILSSGQGSEVIQNAIPKLTKGAQKTIEGNAEFKDAGSFESWQWSQPNLGFNKKNIKTTMAGMFGTDQDKFNSFREQNPDIQIKLDNAKNPYFEDKGKKYYLDMPGLDLGDIGDFAGEAGLYASAGNLAQIKNAGALLNAGKMGLSQGAANVAAQNLAGRDNVDAGEAAMATLGGAAFDLVGSGVNKIRNARAGNNTLTGDKAKALEFAEKNKLNLGYDDLAENAAIRTVGQQVDNMPIVGGGKFREAQNLQQKDIAEKVTKKFLLPDSNIDDLHEIVSGGMKKHMKRSKDIASKKYDKIYSQLDESVGNFNVNSVKNKAQGIIENELKKGSGANKEIISEMQNYLDIPDGNFSQWAEIRSDLTSKTRDLQNTLSGKKTKLAGALKQVNKELNKSMDDVVTESNNPQLQQKWRDANTFYENAVKRYSHGALKQAVKNDNPETILNILMRKGGADATDSTHKAQQLFNGLDKKGKSAVRHGMMERAYKEALTGGDFSPAKYSTMLENYSKRLGVVLSKEDKKVIDGMSAYMRITQSAGNFGRNTPTGQQAVPLLYTGAAIGGGMLDGGTTAAAIAGIQGFKALTRTPRGRSFMLALSSLPKGKKPPPELLTQIARYLAVKEASE